MCHDACLQPGYLPDGYRNAEPGAAPNRFRGKPEYVINFMRFIAEEMREYMAKLGFRTVDEMVGRSDLLKRNDKVTNEHADRVDLSQILNNPFAKAGEKVTFDPKDVLRLQTWRNPG